nr:hypothetical protein BaRGS_032128 [Batillaria attramentaria]
MTRDIRVYCASCDICQKTQAKGRVKDIPLDFMPRIDIPFKRVAVDLVGPIHPPSEEKHTHILTVIDVATRFPEAIPLKKTDSATVAEALLAVFSRMGLPEEIQTDNGSTFTSEMMAEFRRLLSIKSVLSSPYHAQSNGVVERLHGTLKPILKKLITSQPRQWHRYLPTALFSIRELPNASTGYSPFQLLFGRQPRGPVDLLANAWTGGTDAGEAKTTFEYVVDLKNMIYDTCKLAHDAVDQARKTQKMYHDKKSTPRKFSVGDKVLLLLPTTANKLQMQWKGPYTVKEVLNNDYRIEMNGSTKVYHANMLKHYFERENNPASTATAQEDLQAPVAQQADSVPPEETELHFEDVPAQVAILMAEDEDTTLSLPTVDTSPDEGDWRSVHIDPELDADQVAELQKVFESFKDILKDTPGASKGSVRHEIRVTTDTPIRRKPYPLPFAAREDFIREVKELQDLGIIEPSTSPYCSPVVLVPKKNSTKKRLCLDLRALNEVTVFDAEPIPDQEEIFTRLAGAKFFTKFDLAKGYYQLFIEEKDRPKTAFQTPLGLRQFRRVPFGLISAPATFARAMREVLGETGINFFDDILAASHSWRQHVSDVNVILHKLRQGGFTVKPDKVCAGFRKLEFLGHVIGEGMIQPTQDKIDNILKIATPATKKQVRSLLGTVGYYKKFIP